MLPTHTRKLPPAPLLIPSSQAEYPFPPSEKSPLPAIIVTPSSPTSKHDFAIAFLAPPPPPTRPSVFTSFYNYFLAPSTPTSNGYEPIPATPATASHFPPTPGPHRDVHRVSGGGLPQHHTSGYMIHRPAASAAKRLRRTLLLTIPVAVVAFHLLSQYHLGLGFSEGEYASMQEHQPGGRVVATGL